jgi:hypothetical protein
VIRTIVVDVFVEDFAHEKFLLALLSRVAREAGVVVRHQVLSSRGGHARAIEAMVQAQRGLLAGGIPRPLADLFLVGIDGNCTTPREKRKEILARCVPSFVDRLVIACPDPHIERWFMADPEAFHDVVDAKPKVGKEKCQRDFYKHLLASTVASAGQPAPLGGIELADDLVQAMDLFRAGKADPALGQFLDDLRTAIQRFR